MIKATLRTKKINKGRATVYIDYYPPIINLKGKQTRREFLKMYVTLKPKTESEKRHKKETLAIAENIRQNRLNDINKPEIYKPYELEQLKIEKLKEKCFIAYFTELTNKKNGKTYLTWNSALNHLQVFTNGNSLKFKDVNLKFLDDLKEYLKQANQLKGTKKKLHINSASLYFDKIKVALKQSYKDGIIQSDLSIKTKKIKTKEVKKDYLTIEEIDQLAKTPCENETLKRASLFGCLTGLRISDIIKMKFNELEYRDKGYILKYRQQKTQAVEVIPISKEAYSLTNGKNNPKENEQNKKVFENLKVSTETNNKICRWVKEAKINKKIRSHSFRHAYATIQISKGTRIETLQKMLGHKLITTTMRYVNVTDKAKRETTDKIKLSNLSEYVKTINKPSLRVVGA